MKRKDILDALNGIDFDMIEDAEKRHQAHGAVWIRWVAVAACLCLVIAAAIAIPIAMHHGNDRRLEIPGETTGTESTDPTNDLTPGGDIVPPPSSEIPGTTTAGESSSTHNTDNSTQGTTGSNTDQYGDTLDTQAAQTGPSGTSKPNQPGENPNTAAALDKVNNGVLKDASPGEMNLPSNMKELGTSNAKEENNAEKMNATVVEYTLDGGVVNWATEGDLIYVITEGNNRLVVIDSENMAPTSNVPLAGVPAEMNIIGDKIYVSLPDLCRIDIFSKGDLDKEGSLYFDHEVSSFCLDGDYIYYTEHDQHCKVFKKNLTTNAIQTVNNSNGNYISFYEPKVYLNKEDGILYIGETGTTGSAIYYYDANTLILKSVFKKDEYGIMNHTREIFHVGDYIFWGNYCLSDKNAKELICRYGTASYGSVTFASEEMVSTYEGLFLTDTGECVIDYYEAGFDYEYLMVSESYNVFFRERGYDVDTIIGVNFDIQK